MLRLHIFMLIMRGTTLRINNIRFRSKAGLMLSKIKGVINGARAEGNIDGVQDSENIEMMKG
jgi:hypothetical protein